MWYLTYLFAALAAAGSTAPIPIGKGGVVSESDLRRMLFEGYDKLVRPVKNCLTPVKLDVGLSLTAIREVDERHQVLVLDSWIQMRWRDEAFSWDPQQFGGMSTLRLPSSEVWKPDLSLYTATPESALFPTSPTQVLIYNNTDVLWVPMYTISTRCPMFRRSDKNTLVCSIKMGSWTYNTLLLDIQLMSSEVDLSYFQDIHPEWKLQSVVSSRESTIYPCCPEEYPELYFNVTLKKRVSRDEGLRF